MTTTDKRTVYRTCPLCEATCGLEITLSERAIERVRGDADDVFSHGFICPKGAALKQLDADPDRLTRPMIRRGGHHVAVDWDEAFAVVEEGFRGLDRTDRNAVAVYLGNPTVHHLSLAIYSRAFLLALGTQNVYSASTVDQMPKQVSAGLMFGSMLSIPIPDVDRTQHLILFGANPYESNGSLLTAPDLPGRLDAIRARGGRVVVVDPRRTRTAEAADEHVAIRPGTDALLMMGMVHTLFGENLVDLGRLEPHVNGVADLEAVAAKFPPEEVAAACGVEAATIRRLARDLAAAESAAVYGRIGTCTQEFGTTASWLVDALNVLTANLDRPGGAMFPKAATGSANTTGTPGTGRGVRFGRRNTRVRGLPETYGEFPVAALAEEIDTPGDGRVRALVTIAGNPVLSTPNSARLDAALGTLEFMVSVDNYLNETTRHADVILPGPALLTKAHYDVAFTQLSVRNYANWSPPAVELEPGELAESEILLRLAMIATGMDAGGDPGPLDDMVAMQLVDRATRTAGSPVEGRDATELLALCGDRRGPERVVDIMLRTGPYGDGFGADPSGLTLATLEAAPHGVDLGPLEERIPEVLRTPSGRIELAPPELLGDIDRLHDATRRARNGGLVLIGRRHLRSNNSWMHNVAVLVSGPDRCTLQIHPSDAAAAAVEDGALVRVISRTGEIELAAEVTDTIRAGVVSVPHGWGHGRAGTSMSIAAEHPGVNSNLLADETMIDPVSGNSVLNGIPVEVVAV